MNKLLHGIVGGWKRSVNRPTAVGEENFEPLPLRNLSVELTFGWLKCTVRCGSVYSIIGASTSTASVTSVSVAGMSIGFH